MRKIKLAAAVLAAVAGLLAGPVAANAASAGSAESVYTLSSMTRAFGALEPCNGDSNVLCTYSGDVHFQVYSTYSASQIWINGKVSCKGQGYDGNPRAADGPVDITWCGVGGGNGTAVLNVGVNWNVPAWAADGLYERMDLLAGGGGCTTWGTNSVYGYIAFWSNWELSCEAPA
jgi:hypothetical protein